MIFPCIRKIENMSTFFRKGHAQSCLFRFFNTCAPDKKIFDRCRMATDFHRRLCSFSRISAYRWPSTLNSSWTWSWRPRGTWGERGNSTNWRCPSAGCIWWDFSTCLNDQLNWLELPNWVGEEWREVAEVKV